MKYSELPDDYKRLAELRANMNRKDDAYARDMIKKDDISDGFIFETTPEGFDFWYSVYKAKSVEDLPTMPKDFYDSVYDWVTSKVKPVGEPKQVDGSHYATMTIQPIDFILDNELGWCEANVIKYVCRHKNKGGVKDIDKAIHYLELLKAKEYENNKP